MRSYRVSEIPDLSQITFTQAKKIARDLCPEKTDRQISEETGIKVDTITQVLHRPDYHPSVPNLPVICEALGNDIMIEWPAAQRGAYVIYPSQSHGPAQFRQYIADISREFSDLLEKDAQSQLNASPGGESRTPAELAAILRELTQLGQKVEAARLMIQNAGKSTARLRSERSSACFTKASSK